LDFFNGTFLTYVFECCKDPVSLLFILFELIQIVPTLDGLFNHAQKSKVLEKIGILLKESRRDKVG
jgi:hypothetical protein